ncbi:MAG: acyl-CoA dehydrogenase family protein, partial [Dethiobacteria bacterium]
MYYEIDSSIRENEALVMLRNELHRFAREVIRPAARQLDQMPYRETNQEGSPYFEVMRKMKQNGYHRLLVPEEFGGSYSGPEAFNIFFEEIAWGSVGFATAIGVDMIPTAIMSLIGSPELIDEVLRPWMEDEEDKYRGCWSVMDPERGSDYIMAMSMPDPEKLGTKGCCRAEPEGDGWIINGAKSYWTSSAPCATWILTHPLIPPHESPTHVGAAIIPVDAPGVTISPPIDKLGTRDDPQGEIVFDNVRIPGHY